jgi:PIN domain nuclease of toxin-antitoxin system
VRVVADTHAFYWYYRQPQLLSGVALATLHTDLVGGDGVVVSVATATVRGLPLITKDQPITALGVVRIIW